jgi:hypothetical protein
MKGNSQCQLLAAISPKVRPWRRDCINILNLRPQDVFISLVEVKKENWSFGNGEAQYAP